MSQKHKSFSSIRILDGSLEDNPHCSHGPTILFERHRSEKEQTERFFACAASRDRKWCRFYQRFGDKVTKQKHGSKDVGVFESHGQCLKRAKQFQALPLSKRTVCLTCGLLLMPEDQLAHNVHRLQECVSDSELLHPSALLQPLVSNKHNAQYFFSGKTIQFIINLAGSLGYKKLLCVGAPRLHEAVQIDHKESGLVSLLLDIDHRLMQFYEPDCFIRYNMFNHYFFGSEKAKQTLNRFLLEDSGPVLLVTDPPFGGMAELLANSIKALSVHWRATNDIDSSDKLLPLLWFFPYFLEHKVTASLPDLQMIDYKVEYDNHAKFKNRQGSGECTASRQGSVVRVFTNLSPSTVRLPPQEGYRFCKPCQRYVSKENRHCKKCQACTSKDGSTYRHCDECKRCVKPSKQHCHTCGFCVLPGDDPCKKGTKFTDDSNKSTHTQTAKHRKRKKSFKGLEKLKSKKMKLSNVHSKRTLSDNVKV